MKDLIMNYKGDQDKKLNSLYNFQINNS